MTLRACAIVTILATCTAGRLPRSARPADPRPPPAVPIAVAVIPAPAIAARLPAARSWESWPVWAYLEAGSVTLRARLESKWGGITRLSHDQLPLLADATGVSEAFTVTLAALRDHIDVTRPMRQLTSRGEWHVAWAIGFAARADSIGELPTICRGGSSDPFHAVAVPSPSEWCGPCRAVDRPGERAIVCGTAEPAEALRADFIARGLSATADELHAEQRLDWPLAPSHVMLDLREDVGAGTLHATIRATPRTPPAGQVSAAALAAASHVQARSARVDVGAPSTAFGFDLMTPLAFDGFQSGSAGGWIDDHDLIFVETPVDKLAPRVVAYWRTFNGGGMITRVSPMRAPAGVPAGTRRFRWQQWMRDDGVIRRCFPDRRTPGGCRVVSRRPPSTSLASDGEYLLIPADGGTWISTPGGRPQVAAVVDLLASAGAPPTWTLPAVALGKYSTDRAALFWAEHLLASGDLDFQIDGSIRP